jgi:polysaccharide export outer membrane protein
VQREILNSDETDQKNFAVYPVRKASLQKLNSWPRTGAQRSYSWLGHTHGSTNVEIQTGDKIDLVIWDSDPNSLLTSLGQKQVRITGVRVSSNGEIFLPYVNNVKVSGMTTESARIKIQGLMESIAPSAQVQLSVGQGKQREADLVSGVARPGNYPLTDSHFTVLNLISRGGGVSGGLRNPRVRLNRNGRSYVKPIADIFQNPELDTVLRGGDKVIVEQDDRYFLALGATGSEQLIYFSKERINVLDAMALAGGVSDSRGDPAGVLILREYPSSAVRDGVLGPEHVRSIFTVDLTSADGLFSAGKFEIYPTDTVLVTESPIRNVQTVLTLIGSAFGLVNTVAN